MMIKIFFFAVFLMNANNQAKVMTFAYPSAEQCEAEFKVVEQVASTAPDGVTVLPLHKCKEVSYTIKKSTM